VNTGAPWPTPQEAEARVLGIQTKLHRWATGDPARRFGDLYNLVCDPAFLLVGWRRVRANKGARTAGVDGQTAFYVERVRGEEAFLADLRAELKARTFQPLAVRERMIPKPGGKLRRLGIPTVRARVGELARARKDAREAAELAHRKVVEANDGLRDALLAARVRVAEAERGA
jgi:RNA-directed DNA polymerase